MNDAVLLSEEDRYLVFAQLVLVELGDHRGKPAWHRMILKPVGVLGRVGKHNVPGLVSLACAVNAVRELRLNLLVRHVDVHLRVKGVVAKVCSRVIIRKSRNIIELALSLLGIAQQVWARGQRRWWHKVGLRIEMVLEVELQVLLNEA
jgi:hypothetical protein